MDNIVKGLTELKTISTKVTIKESKQIIIRLENVLKITKGYGLTGVQINVPKRVSIIRINDYKLDLINPKIIDKWSRVRFPKEGCLSLPGLRVDTMRYKMVSFENEVDGERIEQHISGLPAMCIQHEVDHMNGITILDRKWRKR